MVYLVLGLSVLVGLGLMGRWLLNADPKDVLKILKWLGVAVVVAATLFFLFRGRLEWVGYVAPLVLPFLLRWGPLLNRFRNMAKAARGPSPGQRSEIRTEFLVMSLDHDTGAMDGEVIAGQFAGRGLDDLTEGELAELHREVAGDQKSRQILEAWLDRSRGDAWREADSDEADGHQERRSGPEPEMTRSYALELLGLQDGASEEEIRAAHKRLMLANHPDRGGSSVLAAQINRAKDVLLGRS